MNETILTHLQIEGKKAYLKVSKGQIFLQLYKYDYGSDFVIFDSIKDYNYTKAKFCLKRIKEYSILKAIEYVENFNEREEVHQYIIKEVQ